MDDNLLEQAKQQLVTIADFVRFAASQFEKAKLFYGHGTDNAFDEAIFLTFFALNIRSEHYSSDIMGCRLLDDEKRILCDLYRRRVHERIPAAYLTNQMSFAGLNFYVDDRVLVPRSPIAEIILGGFSPWCDNIAVENILDLCTGSGCIAIAAAHAFPDATVCAVDISPGALQVAQKNIDRYDLEDRITLYQSDLFADVPQKNYQLIISNPPYVTAYDLQNAPDEFHAEPQLGLAAGEDGLEVVRAILNAAREYLSDDGVLIVEVGATAPYVIEAYPDLPFVWLEFENGGEGVFLLRAQDLDGLSGGE